MNGNSALLSADITLADSLGVRYQTICELEQGNYKMISIKK